MSPLLGVRSLVVWCLEIMQRNRSQLPKNRRGRIPSLDQSTWRLRLLVVGLAVWALAEPSQVTAGYENHPSASRYLRQLAE